MADVFISYARADRERIEKLAGALDAAGYSVWWDRQIVGGAEFGAAIERELGAARAVIVAWSSEASGSRWVRDEASAAAEAGKLIPILMDETAAPMGFRQFHAIDFKDAPGGASGAAFTDLLRAIAARLERAPSPAVAAPNAARSPSLILAALVAALVLGGAAAFLLYARRASPTEPVMAASPAATAPSAPGTSAPRAAPRQTEKSVAVLPFAALSSGADDGYFADGLTEEIINALTTLPDLLVTARTSAFHFKDKDQTVPEIAASLGVAHVVEGSVRRSGGAVRITAQLIRASDGFHLWSQTYDRSADDVFVAQTDIAEHIAEALGVLLDDQGRARMGEIGVRDVEAFIAYQRGHELFVQAHGTALDMATLDAARRQHDLAIKLHSGFHEAYAERADFYAHLVMGDGEGFDAGVTLEEAARRLADELGAASRTASNPSHRAVALLMRTLYSSDWRRLRASYEDTIAAPEKCGGAIGRILVAIPFGYADNALRSSLARTKCDPKSAIGWADAMIAALHLGDASEALRIADASEEALGLKGDRVLNARFEAYLALGRREDAQSVIGELGADQRSLLRARLAAASGRAGDWAGFREEFSGDPLRLLALAAVFGERKEANRLAAMFDDRPLGPSVLARVTVNCACGAPFDLTATPNFARQLKEGGLTWPQASPIAWPLKDW